LVEAQVLVRAAGTIAARGTADTGVRLVETAAGLAGKDVPFKQDLRTPVGQESAAGGLDVGDRAHGGHIDAERGCRALVIGHREPGRAVAAGSGRDCRLRACLLGRGAAVAAAGLAAGDGYPVTRI